MTDRRREILHAALAIADSDGLDAVTMRAVARRVGVTPMALYPYVGGKGALLDGLIEMLLTELPKPDPGVTGWDRMIALAHGVREVAHRHPAVIGLLFSRPSVTADSMRTVDELYGALLGAGVPEGDIARVERLVSTMVIGFALSEVGGRFGTGSLTTRQRRAQLAAADLPAHHRLAEHLDEPVDWDAEFDRDLEDLRLMVERIAAR